MGAFAFAGPDQNLAFGSDSQEAEAAREVAANRIRQSVIPDSGRQEGAISQAFDLTPDDLRNFLRGGLHGALKGRGVQMPDWMDRAADVANSPAFNEALGVTWPQAKILRFREMLSAGRPLEEIAGEFGITPQAAKALSRNKGLPAEMSTRSPRNVMSEADQARLADLVKQGKQNWEIARAMGMKEHNVPYTLKRLGIQKPTVEE